MTKTNQFDWVPFYKELAKKLVPYQNNRQELIEKVRQIYAETGIGMPTLEQDDHIDDLDPFTVCKPTENNSNGGAVIYCYCSFADVI